MSHLKKTFQLLVLPVSYFALSAQGIDISQEFQPAEKFQSVGDVGTLFIQILFALGITFTVIFTILGGIKFISSGGDPNKVAAARSMIVYAVIGLVVLILTFVIMYLVQAVFINNPNL